MEGKIAIEEHFSTAGFAELVDSAGEERRNGMAASRDIERRLLDPDVLVAEMDRGGIELCVASLTSPGAQSIADRGKARELARESNHQAEGFMRRHPGRLSAFAAIALHDVKDACDELDRTVGSGRFPGVLLNGYTNVDDGEGAFYLDERPLDEFWGECVRLRAPVYLHPREPLPGQRRVTAGFPELDGSAWAFFYETATHAVRLMLSGVFDRFPELQFVLGHMGEGLPLMLPRLQHRLDRQRDGRHGASARRRVGHYLANNFHVTTSGHFHRIAFHAALDTMGADRVMFSVDYPYEDMLAGCDWYDELALASDLKHRIGRENANRLFRLGLSPDPASVSRTAAS